MPAGLPADRPGQCGQHDIEEGQIWMHGVEPVQSLNAVARHLAQKPSR